VYGPGIGRATDGGFRGHNNDAAAVRLAVDYPAGGFGSGLYYTHYRQRGIGFVQFRQSGGGSGVTGDHQELYPALHKLFRGLQGIADNGAGTFGAVRQARGVPEIAKVLLRQAFAQGGKNGQPAHARVKKTDRQLCRIAVYYVHCAISLFFFP
jgi:hypothetical protein